MQYIPLPLFLLWKTPSASTLDVLLQTLPSRAPSQRVLDLLLPRGLGPAPHRVSERFRNIYAEILRSMFVVHRIRVISTSFELDVEGATAWYLGSAPLGRAFGLLFSAISRTRSV